MRDEHAHAPRIALVAAAALGCAWLLGHPHAASAQETYFRTGHAEKCAMGGSLGVDVPGCAKANDKSGDSIKVGTRGLVIGDVPTRPTHKGPVAIQFQYNSASLTPAATRDLDQLAQVIKAGEIVSLRFHIEGHTDATGTPEYNQKLSEERAKSVVSYLVTHHGIDPGRVSWQGKGERDLYDAANPDDPLNRRVTIQTVTN